MKNKNIFTTLCLFFLGACAAPTSSIELSKESIDKNGYLFYYDKDINLHISELTNKLILPAEEYTVPSYTNLLPNAKREYRSGHHMGVDFSSPMNYPIKAAYGGVVVRSNAHQEDVDIETYEYFLDLSAKVGKTPDDIYNFILLGKSVVIDHGFNITEKYRSITVYSHLSSITEGLVAGSKVKQGEVIGLSGNTGTSSGSLRNNRGSHLHWEIFFDDDSGRYYLGQNIPPELLKLNIELLFMK
jgi:murein DD-endopeptidase MepM/ murein hydrolase activator NlpD